MVVVLEALIWMMERSMIMSNKDDVRDSLLSIAELLKQLTEEIESLASCFCEEDEDSLRWGED